MKKIVNVLYHICQWTVTSLMTFITSGILILSLICVCYFNAREHVYLYDDKTLLQFVSVFALGVAAVLCAKNPRVKKLAEYLDAQENYRKVLKVILSGAFIVGLVWIFSSQYISVYDQDDVLEAVSYARHGNMESFFGEGYLQRYPHQTGLMIFEMILGYFFGDYNYVIFQLCNVFAYVLILRELAWESRKIGLRNIYAIICALAGMFFLPLLFYTSHVYGILLGLMFSLLAIRHEFLFTDEHRMRDAVLSCLWIAAAVVVKSNYLIFGIGMILYLSVHGLKNREIKSVYPGLMLILALVVGNGMPKLLVEKVTGADLSHGVISEAWVVMGLSDNGHIGPGWYSGYNLNTYLEAEGDPEVQRERVRADLKERISAFLGDKRYAAKFFVKKWASEWCDPTFGGIWILQAASPGVELPQWQWYIRSVPGAKRVTGILNILHLWILFGSILYVFSPRLRDKKTESLMFCIIFIGGFLFHTFWEAKSQYVLPYFVLLIPLAVSGYAALIQNAEEAIKDGKAAKSINVILAVCVMTVGGVMSYALPLEALRSQDEKKEYDYYYQMNDIGILIRNGVYQVVSADEGCEFVCGVVNYRGKVYLRDEDRYLYLSAGETPGEDKNADWTEWDRDEAQQWKLIDVGDGSCFIRYNDLFLTAEDGELTLQKRDDNAYMQKWKFNSVKNGQ